MQELHSTNAKIKYKIDGVVHGGISSTFQKKKFENVCSKLDLIPFGPLWNSNPNEYMNNLLDSNFTFIITSVTSDGLDDKWLGIPVTKSHLYDLEKLSTKFDFNLKGMYCPMLATKIYAERSESG